MKNKKENINNHLSFKEQMQKDIIPRVYEMIQKEKENLKWLLNNNAPDYMIENSIFHLQHFKNRHKEYIEYIEKIK